MFGHKYGVKVSVYKMTYAYMTSAQTYAYDKRTETIKK